MTPDLASRIAERVALRAVQVAHDQRRDAFAREFRVRPIRWSAYNVSRLIRQTGERPERVAEMRAILGRLGMGDHRWPSTLGIFDHGGLWARSGKPWCITGHPYGIAEEERELLAMLGRFGPLRVSVNDRESCYGWGSDAVRVELIEPRRPFTKPPSTAKTRAARKMFAAAMATR